MAATQPVTILLSSEEEAFVGQTPYFRALIYDGNGSAVDPDTSFKITVNDHAGTVLVNAQAMTKVTTGDYKYISYTVASNTIPGTARWRVAVTDSNVVTTEESTIRIMDR